MRIRLLVFCFVFWVTFSGALAHPLGQYTVNHYARIEVGRAQVKIRYVVDLAELAAFPEIQTADTDGNGSLSDAESKAYLGRIVPQMVAALQLTTDGQPLALRATNEHLSLPPGAANLPTMRIECDLEGTVATQAITHFAFADSNHAGRQGWREIVIVPAAGITVFDSTAFGNGLTNELQAYPEDLLLAPLNEREATWSATTGALPTGAKALLTRTGKPVVAQRDRFAELISVPALTPGFVLLALLLAFVFGGAHALSPGHGKTVVGAYLVGARGTAKHAAFLGLTVTITHTSSVIALGLVTLFASQYIVPERLYPILSLVSGALVLGIGLRLLAQRLRTALGGASEYHHHHDSEVHEHTHDGQTHSHLPPEQITWRNLLALGISGGLLPCPSALVLMLSAIALHRVGFGLVLIVAFSLGLASVLTLIGLAFVYAGKLLKAKTSETGWLHAATRILPILSATVIAALGGVILWQAFTQVGVNFGALWNTAEPTGSLSTVSVLTLGLILGLKHAIEADHLAAVTTIVTERKSLWSSSLVGGLWGIGHTIPILVVGLVVILLRIEIKNYVGVSLEFCVGLMLIALGAQALWKLSRSRQLHLHVHEHGGQLHVHPHFHTADEAHEPHTHHNFKLSLRPLFVGVMHGLAGSAALVPLVVAEIRSPFVGLFYMLVFGLGSIGGMMLMSALVGLPLHLTAARFARFNVALRVAAGVFSIGFGLLMVYQIGFGGGVTP